MSPILKVSSWFSVSIDGKEIAGGKDWANALWNAHETLTAMRVAVEEFAGIDLGSHQRECDRCATAAWDEFEEICRKVREALGPNFVVSGRPRIGFRPHQHGGRGLVTTIRDELVEARIRSRQKPDGGRYTTTEDDQVRALKDSELTEIIEELSRYLVTITHRYSSSVEFIYPEIDKKYPCEEMAQEHAR